MRPRRPTVKIFSFLQCLPAEPVDVAEGEREGGRERKREKEREGEREREREGGNVHNARNRPVHVPGQYKEVIRSKNKSFLQMLCYLHIHTCTCTYMYTYISNVHFSSLASWLPMKIRSHNNYL